MVQEEFRDLAVRNGAELARIKDEVMASSLYNEDLAPAGPEERTWTTSNIAALWIGMAIVITTYTLASGLMVSGMNWWQALLTISLGNIIVLVLTGSTCLQPPPAASATHCPRSLSPTQGSDYRRSRLTFY